MTTDRTTHGPSEPEQSAPGGDPEALAANLAKIEALSQRLVAAMGHRRQVPPELQGPGADLFLKAASAAMAEMMANPGRMIERQVAWWGRALRHQVEAQRALAAGIKAPAEPVAEPDKRFKGELWQTHPFFNYVMQQYLISADAIGQAVADLPGLEERERKRVAYFSRQIVDLMAPSNFLATNPEALARAVETDGQSLVDGLENLVRDIEAGQGELRVTLSKPGAFEVGRDVATAEGSVVHRGRLFELIQYAPTTETVHARPLVLFPPWINKFYILDLRPENSLIRWIVDQGHTLFVVSWKNPDASYRDTAIDHYVEEGFRQAIEVAKEITGQKDVNAAAYCIGGTTLALTLASMRARGIKDVASATFLTTLTDFSDQGEVGVFLDDGFVGGIEAEVARAGVLDSFFMSRTFSYLRSGDLIYAPAIRSYMMGQPPPAFDLLHWNGDGTNLPARMAVQYLRDLCQHDRFSQGGIEIGGHRLHLRDVEVPFFSVACEADHIAAWRSCYAGARQMGAKDRTFVLSQSGHIAGIVNPPGRKKYGHWAGGGWDGDAEAWRDGSSFEEGSWLAALGRMGWPGAPAGASRPACRARADAPYSAPRRGTYVTEVPGGEPK